MLIGAIFDTRDTLSRQAFEYAIAKINVQSQIFTRSKLVVSQIDVVDGHDSFSAYKMGKTFFVHSSKSILSLFIQFVHNYKKVLLLYLLVDLHRHLDLLVH